MRWRGARREQHPRDGASMSPIAATSAAETVIGDVTRQLQYRPHGTARAVHGLHVAAALLVSFSSAFL